MIGVKKIHFTFLLLFGALLFALPANCRATAPIQVLVSILPQKYFVDRIAGEFARVSVMVPPGSNPATYEPKPTQMRALVRSEIYFAIGAPFEGVWLKKIATINQELMVVHTDRLIKKRRIDAHFHSETTDQKGKMRTSHGGPDKEAWLDPHIWLSPPLVKLQARVIADAFIRIDPQRKDMYEKNLRAFYTELDRLDREIRGLVEGNEKKREILVFHPSWGYFAEAYGLTQIPVEIEGKEPSAVEMARLVIYARDKGVKVIFVQPQFATKSAEAIAREIGARVVVADPLAENWAENLREVAAKFREALR
jgi:zinc transport system substrate-binding protein